MDRAKRVYEWTELLYPHSEQPRLSIDDACDVIRHAWSIYRDNEPPRLIVGRNAQTDGRIIELPYQARTMPIILHEVAHALVLDTDDDPHGECFIRTVIELYEAFLPKRNLINSAALYNLI